MAARLRTWRLAAGIAVASVAGAGLACGPSQDEKATCKAQSCPFDYASFDAQSPAVSFEEDVLPLFRRSCGLSKVCHGHPTESAANLYLGPKRSDTTTIIDQALKDQIVSSIVSVKSKIAPSMNLVTSDDPTQSFLMLKMDGCQNGAGLDCSPVPEAKSKLPCGDSMPQGNGTLCANERNVIRRWIAQGAKAE